MKVMKVRGTLLIGLLQPFEGLTFVAESGPDDSHIVRRDIRATRWLRHLLENLDSFAATSRYSEAISEPCSIKRVPPGKRGCALKFLNSFRKHFPLHVNPPEVRVRGGQTAVKRKRLL